MMLFFRQTRPTSMRPLWLVFLSFSSLEFSQTQILSTKIFREDWGLKQFNEIQYGQVTFLHEPQGDRLVVYSLYNSAPTVPSRTIRSYSPPASSGPFLVSNFDSGMRNSLGGSFNSFQRSPSSASASYAHVKDGRRALRVSYKKESEGFCGFWIHLFNSTSLPEERSYFDSRSFSFLTFWIRGSTGQEQLAVKIADAVWELKEDALPIGGVGSFLPSGHIDTTWQQAVVPLSQLPTRILKDQLATLSFEATGLHSGSVDIKTLAFCRNRSEFPSLPSPFSKTSPARKLDRALWVWNTDELFVNGSKKDNLFDIIARDKISHVFLAIPYKASRDVVAGGISIDTGRMRPLISELQRKGVKVHALLGDKDFILPAQRPFVTRSLENIVAYNSSSKPDERFVGIHFDVEPYLLPGFGGTRRSWILENFLDLLADAGSIAHRGGILVGADIPFWLDSVDEFLQDRPVMTFRGITKPVYEHVIDLIDLVGLMSYRTFAAGADGIVLHSSDELEYASKTGKHVFVGLETSPLPDENILTFRGLPTNGLPQKSSGYSLICIPRGDSAEIVLAKDVQQLGNRLRDEGVQTDKVLSWPVTKDVFVPRTKVSFATLGKSTFQQAVDQLTEELSSFSAFDGVAIHHSESYLDLLRRP